MMQRHDSTATAVEVLNSPVPAPGLVKNPGDSDDAEYSAIQIAVMVGGIAPRHPHQSVYLVAFIFREHRAIRTSQSPAQPCFMAS